MYRQLKSVSLLIWIVIFSSLVINLANAQEIAKAYIPFVFQADLPYSDQYAMQYTLDGDTALVGKRFDASSVGSVEVYVRQGNAWVFQANLTPSDQTPGYGIDGMTLQGNTAVIGATGSYDRYTGEGIPGALYVFTRSGTTWSQTARIAGTLGDGFGYELDLDGNWLVQSSYGAYDDYESSIDFYEFAGGSWQHRVNFKPDVQPSIDESWVVLDGDYALTLAGTHEYYEEIYQAYKRSGNTWIEMEMIDPPDNKDHPLALDGNTALIGPYVYVTDGTNWTLQQTLLVDGQQLGLQKVALAGDTALLNAYTNYGDPVQSYIFTRSGNVWTQQQQLTTPQGNSFRGYSTALTATTALVDNHVFTNNQVAPTNLLVNGGFEIDSNGDFVPDGWSRKNSVGDGRRCNQAQHPAYEGACSYLFKADPSAQNKLVQNVDLNVHDLNAGDRIKLNGFYKKQGAGSIQVRLFVSYASLPQDQARITVTSSTSGYIAMPSPAITLKAKPTRVRVEIQNETTSGKTWFDALSLNLTDNSAIVPLLPLPAAP